MVFVYTLSIVVINNERNINPLKKRQKKPIITLKGFKILKIFCNPSKLFSIRSIFSFFVEINLMIIYYLSNSKYLPFLFF